MTSRKFVSYLFLILCSVQSSYATAAPSAGIQKLLSTPASAFDVFLQQIYVAANGPSYFGGPNWKEQLHIFDLEYDRGSNLIYMKFHIGAEHKLMQGFSSRNIDGKKDLMLRAAKEIAESLGIAPRDGLLRFGLIQSVTIRNGWSTKDFDEVALKEEIANRTVFELVYPCEEHVVYTVRRTEAGRYEFSLDTKSAN